MTRRPRCGGAGCIGCSLLSLVCPPAPAPRLRRACSPLLSSWSPNPLSQRARLGWRDSDRRTQEEATGWMEGLVGTEPDRDAPADRLGWRGASGVTRMERAGSVGATRIGWGIRAGIPMPRTGAFLQAGQRPIQMDGLGRRNLKRESRSQRLGSRTGLEWRHSVKEAGMERLGWRDSDGALRDSEAKVP